MNTLDIDRRNGYRPGVGLLLLKNGRILLGCGASYLTAFRFEGEEVLLVEQDGWKFGWDLPQGGIESGESFEQAIRREASEELGSDWKLDSRMDHFRREQLDFPVRKDGVAYRGKTYYYHMVEVSNTPIGYDDWVFGPHADEGPYAYPAPEFPGGVKFLGHQDACNAILTTRNDRKSKLVLNLLNELRRQRFIRA